MSGELRYRGRGGGLRKKQQSSRSASLPPAAAKNDEESSERLALALASGGSSRSHASGASETMGEVDEILFASAVGGEMMEIPRRTSYTQSFALNKGDSILWDFRVHSHDLGFSLRRRKMAVGGAVEDDLIEPRRVVAGIAVSGRWRAASDAQVVVVLDNAYSLLRSKRVVAKLRVLKAQREVVDDSTLRSAMLLDQAKETDSIRQRLQSAQTEGKRLKRLSIVDDDDDEARQQSEEEDELNHRSEVGLGAIGADDDAPTTADLLAFLDAHQPVKADGTAVYAESTLL